MAGDLKVYVQKKATDRVKGDTESHTVLVPSFFDVKSTTRRNHRCSCHLRAIHADEAHCQSMCGLF